MKRQQMPDSLTTERLSLRWFTEDDAALMLEIWNDRDFLRNVGDRGIRTLEAASEALGAGILAMYGDHGYGPYRVATRDDDEPAGICGLFRRDYLDDPDIGFALLPAYRRQSYGYEASRVVLDAARSVSPLERVTAIVSPGNRQSIRLIEKLGLVFEKRLTPLGEEQDVLLYAIDLR